MRQGLVARIALVFGAVAAASCLAITIDAIALTDIAQRTSTLLGRDMVNNVAVTRSQNHLQRMNSNLVGAMLAGHPDAAALDRLVRKSMADYRDRLGEMRAASPVGAQQADDLMPGFESLQTTLDAALALIRTGDLEQAGIAVGREVTRAVEQQVTRGCMAPNGGTKSASSVCWPLSGSTENTSIGVPWLVDIASAKAV